MLDKEKKHKNCFMLPTHILVPRSLNFLFDVGAVDLVHNVLLHPVNTQFERRDYILSTTITVRLTGSLCETVFDVIEPGCDSLKSSMDFLP